jgi:hypothetical protein
MEKLSTSHTPAYATYFTRNVHAILSENGCILPQSRHDVPISYYPAVSQPASQETIELGEWLEGTRDGRWRNEVEPVRDEYRLNGKSKRYRAMKVQLPAVAAAGTFTYREIVGFSEPSGVLHGDVDGLTARRLQWAREGLQGDPHVLYLFASPSAAGLKFGVVIPLVDSDVTYKMQFWGLHHYCRRVYGVELDESCQDISRLCFVSFDPECYINSHPKLFTQTGSPPKEHTKPLPNPVPLMVPTHINPTEAPSDSRQLRWALSQVRNAPLGTRHATRLKIGQLVGGWITGGQLAPTAAELLAETAAAHSDHPPTARRDIADALRYGSARPISAENQGFDALVARARSRQRCFNGRT